MILFSVLLAMHVAIGGVALAAGAMALAAPKGGLLHRRSGTVFLAAMLAMTSVAFLLALMHRDLISIVPAMLTFYLVASGWRTVKARTVSGIDHGLTVLALAASATGYALGVHAAGMPSGMDDKGFPAAVYFVFATVALLAAGGDLYRLVAGPTRGLRRLARHVWRMSVAMFVATTSLFQGQEQVFPKGLQGSFWLQLPAFWVMAVAVWWLVRLALRMPPRPGARKAMAAGTLAADI
ncbi:MAG TPA: hypothetical protein VFW19_08685 [Allosphingosinicella sp.]|nr:hypothetical protein [Allosphingosinicella sp.]